MIGRPIVDQYREGKVGSTPNRGVKCKVKSFRDVSRSESESEQGAKVSASRRET